MTCSVISCFQFLQVILKGCAFTFVQNGNIGLKYQKISKTAPAFPRYISIFLSPVAKGAEKVLTVVRMTTMENEAKHLQRYKSQHQPSKNLVSKSNP